MNLSNSLNNICLKVNNLAYGEQLPKLCGGLKLHSEVVGEDDLYHRWQAIKLLLESDGVAHRRHGVSGRGEESIVTLLLEAFLTLGLADVEHLALAVAATLLHHRHCKVRANTTQQDDPDRAHRTQGSLKLTRWRRWSWSYPPSSV